MASAALVPFEFTWKSCWPLAGGMAWQEPQTGVGEVQDCDRIDVLWASLHSRRGTMMSPFWSASCSRMRSTRSSCRWCRPAAAGCRPVSGSTLLWASLYSRRGTMMSPFWSACCSTGTAPCGVVVGGAGRRRRGAGLCQDRRCCASLYSRRGTMMSPFWSASC